MGVTYKKVVSALLGLTFAVTMENAKGLSKKGNNKVPNIGKSSSEKIYEFVTTGKINKLEEKRADAS